LDFSIAIPLQQVPAIASSGFSLMADFHIHSHFRTLHCKNIKNTLLAVSPRSGL
jgi:hypothetical protein